MKIDDKLVFGDVFAESVSSPDGTTIRDVLLCGTGRSLNGHEIPASAFRNEENAKRLYSNAPVHLEHNQANPIRPVSEIAAIVTNVRLSDGKPRGDFLLSESQSGQELRKLFEFSKRVERAGAKLQKVGCSHVARYTFTGGDRRVVESVDEVFSVDVCSNPATTRSFKESQHSTCVPFDPMQALKSLNRQDWGDFDPRPALDQLRHWESGGADVPALMKQAEIHVNNGFDVVAMLKTVSFT